MQLWKEIPRDNYRRKTKELGEQEMKEILGLEIERKWFQVKELTARESANMIDAYNHTHKYVDIYDAYKKPSEAKVSVWNKWVQWAEDVNTFDYTYVVKNLSVCDTNCQMFTVYAIVREFDEDEIGNRLPVATYIMAATKYRKCLYLLASDESGEDIDICQ